MPAREKTSATFLAAAGEPPGTVERGGGAEIGRLADGCSARPRYRLLRGELIGRSSRSVAPIILGRQRNYKANSCQAAIPEPRGQACSKSRGSLEMPALRAEGEIRDERFWPERGKNQGIGYTAVAGSYRRADPKLRGGGGVKGKGGRVGG